MIELARLYQEVAELVQQQEPAVEQINQGAHDVVENVDNANKQIDSAIVSARNARRWKWYILIVVSKYYPHSFSLGRQELTLPSPDHRYRCRCGRWCHRSQQVALNSTLRAKLTRLTKRVMTDYPRLLFLSRLLLSYLQL